LGQHCITPSPVLPPLKLTPVLGQEVLKIHANINNLISALNVRESPKFFNPLKIGVEKHNIDVRF